MNQFYVPGNPNALQSFDPDNGLAVSGSAYHLNGFPSFCRHPWSSLLVGHQYDLGRKLGRQAGLSRQPQPALRQAKQFKLLYTPLNPRVQHLYFYSNDANGSYNALLVELQHRFSRQFQFDVQYRWSHTIDDGSNDYFIGEYPFGLQYLKGNADFDVRHNVKMYGVWSPRFTREPQLDG